MRVSFLPAVVVALVRSSASAEAYVPFVPKSPLISPGGAKTLHSPPELSQVAVEPAVEPAVEAAVKREQREQCEGHEGRETHSTQADPKVGHDLEEKPSLTPATAIATATLATEASTSEQNSITSSITSSNTNTKINRICNRFSWLASIDGIVFSSYLCNVLALSLPVLLVPIAATEHVKLLGGVSSSSLSESLSAKVVATVAGISSVATLGGATGKFTNGFICQAVGSYKSSKVYFLGLSACSLVFSLSQTPSTMGMALAGMEFFASIQWAALAVMLSNFYANSPVKLAAALTALGLSSTSGQIAAKTLGMFLASHWHWRKVAQLGSLTALLGSLMIARAPQPDATVLIQTTTTNKLTWKTIGHSLKAIFGSSMFWMLAMAHSMAFVARGTDRILGTFFQHMAGLPTAIAGGMTLCITLGLVHGLVTGNRKFVAAADVPAKKRFLAKRYAASILATGGLIATAQHGAALTSSKAIITGIIALLAGTMASNIAFQYFQFPAMIAKSQFSEHKAVVISFLDGFGFLFSAPIFAATSRLVPSLGWSSAWGMLAVLFGGAAVLMLSAIAPVLQNPKENQVETG